VQFCSGQNAIPIVQCCSAKQAQSRQCVTAVTPTEFCSSYRCAVSQQECSAALLKAKSNPHCSVLLCKAGSQQSVCHCSYTYGGLLLTQVCREPAQIQCSSAQGKMQSPLFSAALQSRLTAVSVSLQLHLWSFALLRVCREPAQMHCSSVQGKMHSPLFSAALQSRLKAGSVALQLHLWRFALHTGVK